MDNRSWLMCTKWHGNDAYLLAKEAVNQLNKFGFNIELDETQHSGSVLHD